MFLSSLQNAYRQPHSLYFPMINSPVLLRNVFIVDMARVVFVRRADTFTSDVLGILQSKQQSEPAPYVLHEEPTANHLSDLFQEFNAISDISKQHSPHPLLPAHLSLSPQPRQHGQQPAEAQPAPEASRHVGAGLLAAAHRLTAPPRRRHHFRFPPVRVRRCPHIIEVPGELRQRRLVPDG